MKKFVLLVGLFASFSIFAADNTSDTKTSLSCLDKQTFEVDANCISTTIEMSDEFLASQQEFYQEASRPGDYVMATLLMDPVSLNITVIGHRDKMLALASNLDEK